MIYGLIKVFDKIEENLWYLQLESKKEFLESIDDKHRIEVLNLKEEHYKLAKTALTNSSIEDKAYETIYNYIKDSLKETLKVLELKHEDTVKESDVYLDKIEDLDNKNIEDYKLDATQVEHLGSILVKEYDYIDNPTDIMNMYKLRFNNTINVIENTRIATAYVIDLYILFLENLLSTSKDNDIAVFATNGIEKFKDIKFKTFVEDAKDVEDKSKYSPLSLVTYDEMLTPLENFLKLIKDDTLINIRSSSTKLIDLLINSMEEIVEISRSEIDVWSFLKPIKSVDNVNAFYVNKRVGYAIKDIIILDKGITRIKG